MCSHTVKMEGINWALALSKSQVAAARERAAAGQPCSPRRHMGAQLLRGRVPSPQTHKIKVSKVLRFRVVQR